MRPYVDKEKCCCNGDCEAVCPADPNVFEIKEKAEVVHPDACVECMECEEACPTSAIEVK